MSCRVLMCGTTAVNLEILQVIRVVSLYVGSCLKLRQQCLLINLLQPLLFELKLFFEHLIKVVVFLLLYLLCLSNINLLGVINWRRYRSPSSVSSFALYLWFWFHVRYFLHIMHCYLLTWKILVLLLISIVPRCEQLNHPMVLSLIWIRSPCHQYPLILHNFHFSRGLVVLWFSLPHCHHLNKAVSK